VDLAIDKGSRVVVLGLNGAGKTTLLKLLAGQEQPDSGEVVPGTACGWATTPRSTTPLDLDATVWDCIRHAAPDAPEQRLRTLLGAFLFSGDQLKQIAGTLSGGEKTRLALAGLVSSAANVLLLDEPTNTSTRSVGSRCWTRCVATRGCGVGDPRPGRGPRTAPRAGDRVA